MKRNASRQKIGSGDDKNEAAVGAMFRPGAWYADLQKPPGMPAGMVFAGVWSALYLLMGIAVRPRCCCRISPGYALPPT